MVNAVGHINLLAEGKHRDPFSLLGSHVNNAGKQVSWRVRCLLPQADLVEIVFSDDSMPMHRVHDAGVFEVELTRPVADYQLRLHQGSSTHLIHDPYAFPSPLGELDHHLMKEGTLQRLEQKLGAHPIEVQGVAGIHFAVWAPNAGRVSVIGDFNDWDGRRHQMRFHPRR